MFGSTSSSHVERSNTGISRETRRTSRRTTGSTLAPPSSQNKWSARQSLYFASSKLDLVKNPVQQEDDAGEGEERSVDKDEHHQPSQQDDHDEPESPENEKELPLKFYRKESASMSELFYDLWFVANLNVFTTVHPITESGTLGSFVGYFLLLWITWFITTVFDARFGQDGILERIARACHLAVMVGFAIVGVTFSEDKLIKPIFQATSLFLMISRLVLAAQYGLVLFHARHHQRSRRTLTLAMALHLLPAIAYLIVAFLSTERPDKSLFWIWYSAGLIEMGAIILHATFSRTLSFEGTYFNERLNLLTLIILGEGVIILTKNITKIVEYTFIKGATDNWSPALVGVIICSAATLYITFQLYFDWMHYHSYMKSSHQAYWAIIHLPFHIALVLLAEGSAQWDVWWRAIESFHTAKNQLQEAVQTRALESMSTDNVVEGVRESAYAILYKYSVDVDQGGSAAKSLDEAFSTMGEIRDQFWDGGRENPNDPDYDKYMSGSTTILSTAMNAISDAFQISVEDEKESVPPTGWDSAEIAAVDRTAQRLLLILVYIFLSAGLVLILLMLMHLLSKRRGWSLFNILRTATVFTIGVGLGLVALIATNDRLASNFLKTPWQLPLITISYFFTLVLTHLPHPPRIFIKPSEVDKTELAERQEPETSTEEQNSVQWQGAPPPDNQLQVPQARVKQPLKFRRGLTTMRNIRIERAQPDPVAEVDEQYLRPSPMDRSPLTPLRSSVGLYRV